MDTLGSPTVQDDCKATKNERPQQSDGLCFPLGQNGVIEGGKRTQKKKQTAEEEHR
jgi:hypothetical protein